MVTVAAKMNAKVATVDTFCGADTECVQTDYAILSGDSRLVIVNLDAIVIDDGAIEWSCPAYTAEQTAIIAQVDAMARKIRERAMAKLAR